MNDESSSRRVALIEERLDVEQAGRVPIKTTGGVQFATMMEVMDFAKLMAVSKSAVPVFMRGEAGICLAIAIQAIEWNMSPFSVARKAYAVKDIVAYESQLVHAVIEARAPLSGRLRCEYEGDGVDRVCIVTGYLRGEAEPFVLRTPPIGRISPQNSPLWKTDPDQQLWYYGSRAWCRRYCPDVLLGIYTPDEVVDSPIGESSDAARDVSPRLMERLSGRMEGPGFSPTVVDDGLAETVVDDGLAETTPEPEPERKPRGRTRKAKDEPPVIEAVPAPEPAPAAPEPPAAIVTATQDEYEFIDLEVFDADRFVASVKMALAQAKGEKDMQAVKDEIIVPNRSAANLLGDGTWDLVVVMYRERMAELGLAPSRPAQKPVDAPKPVAASKVPGMAADAPAASKLATPSSAEHPGHYADGKMRLPIYAKQYPTWVKHWLGAIADPVKLEEQWLDDADIRKELRMVKTEVAAARALVDAELTKRKKAK